MSGLLGRLAARAVGEAAAAAPRVPGFFEPPGTAPAATLDVVDEEVVAQARAAPAPAPRPSEPAVRSGAAPPAGRPPRETPVPGLPLDAAAAEAAAPPAPEVAPPPGAAAARARELPGQPAREPVSAERATAEPQPEAPARPARPAAPVRPLPAAVVPAVPAPSPLLPPAAAPPATAAVTRDEPPAVRVHIGRLEVRANLQEPPRSRPPRERPTPDALSLGDYLRGKRGAVG